MRQLKTWISKETGPKSRIDALMSVIVCRVPLTESKLILQGQSQNWLLT